jgi:hypothetical protein
MRAARQPASAAVAGLVFGGTLSWVIYILQGVAPSSDLAMANQATTESFRASVTAALSMIPFAAIAFLWFTAVIRVRLGSREDRFFETVFLGSGLIFVAMLFAAGGALGGALGVIGTGSDATGDTVLLAWSTALWLLGTFGARMAAVFILSVTTMGLRMRTVPKWLAAWGYVTAVLLLVTPPFPRLSQYLFPLWVIVVSVFILVRRREAEPSAGAVRNAS